jgi:hypothetical protein
VDAGPKEQAAYASLDPFYKLPQSHQVALTVKRWMQKTLARDDAEKLLSE